MRITKGEKELRGREVSNGLLIEDILSAVFIWFCKIYSHSEVRIKCGNQCQCREREITDTPRRFVYLK